MKRTPLQLFWMRTDNRGPDECWPWNAGLSSGGYGRLGVGGERSYAHRFAYEMFIGPICDGLEIDHICHTRDTSCPGGSRCLHRRCVNPSHLEPVSSAENSRRGRSTNGRKTHCVHGRPYDAVNTHIDARGRRGCRLCNRDRDRRRREARLLRREAIT